MGRFNLQFDDETRPIKRGGSVGASFVFVVKMLATTIIAALGLGYGLMLAKGDISPLERFWN